MLTVRKVGTAAGKSTVSVDCVVFHNRRASDPEEELVHTVTNLSGNAIDVQFTVYPSGNPVPLRKGGYLFDPAHAKWYLVRDILNETSTDATIELDRFPTDPITRITIPRGVVGVFPFDQQTVQGR